LSDVRGSQAGSLRHAGFLVLATLAQIAFWRFATPGPTLLDGVTRSPTSAAVAVAWSAGTLLVAALLAVPLLRVRPKDLGFTVADTRKSLVPILLVASVAVPVLLLQGADPLLASTYPWTGAAWLAQTPTNWLVWAGLYGGYYLSFEAFYRGAILHALVGSYEVRTALLLQAMLATLIHVGKPMPEVLAAFPASLLFGWLTIRSKSILPALVLHLLIGLAMDAGVILRAGG